ncbi:MAG: preprotein translocase subunit YajC, partial [Duncaniella sp.]|nr:preprotein translocase subunit YajC [Duncaniella sp.]
RPQQKRQNEIKKFRECLRVNDNNVTAGGIYGKVKSIDDTTFTIEIAKDVRITVDKGSVYPSAQQAMRDAAEKENK